MNGRCFRRADSLWLAMGGPERRLADDGCRDEWQRTLRSPAATTTGQPCRKTSGTPAAAGAPGVLAVPWRRSADHGHGTGKWICRYGESGILPPAAQPAQAEYQVRVVMFDGKAPKAHVRVGTVKVDTDRVVARQEAKRG